MTQSLAAIIGARTIPFQWSAAVKAQLASMVTKGVIEKVPVGESFTWCHPMMVVPKKSSAEPQITVDLTGLNKYVQRSAYPTECQTRSSPASHQACGILRRWTRGRLLADSPGRRKLKVDHLHHSVGSLPFPAKRYGAHLSRRQTQPARRRGTRRR